jgi:hypothetical protein
MGRWNSRRRERNRVILQFPRVQIVSPKTPSKLYPVKDPSFIQSVKIIAKNLEDFKQKALKPGTFKRWLKRLDMVMERFGRRNSER